LSIYKRTLAEKSEKAILSGGLVGILAKSFPLTAPFAWGLSGLFAVCQLLKNEESYKVYDWIEEDGRNSLGDWIEEAAQQAGR
jgi:hypothetical protein